MSSSQKTVYWREELTLLNNAIQVAFMKLQKRLLAIASVGILALTLSACEKEGSAEKAGKSVDETLEKAGESLEKAKESIAETINPKGPAEKAGEAIDEAAESINKKIEEATEE